MMLGKQSTDSANGYAACSCAHLTCHMLAIMNTSSVMMISFGTYLFDC